MAYNTFTLTGTFKRPDNAADRGGVVAIPSVVPLVDSAGKIILAGAVQAQLDSSGTFTMTLPTTGGNLLPASFGYTLIYTTDGHGRTSQVTFTPPASGTTLNVADIVPAPLPAVVTPTAVTTAGLDGAVQSLVNDVASAARAALSATYARAFMPEKYGADATGVADSRVAIQSAVDAARDAGGGIVVLDGTYRVDAPIVPRNNVALVGRGWGRSIIKPTSSWNAGLDGSVLQVGGSSGSPIQNFTVTGIKFDLSDVPSGVQAKAIFCTYMRNLRFEDNWVLNSTATGIGADFLDGGVIRGNRVEGCGRHAEGNEATFLGCSGIGIGTGIWGDEATLVEGNFVYNAVRFGIFVEYQSGISSEFTRGVKIVNNHVRGAYWGIGSSGVAWMHIVGNTVEQCDQDGILISPGNAGGKSWGDLIALNTVLSNGGRGLTLDFTNAGSGSPSDAGKLAIVNNRFVGNTGVGVKIIAPSALSGFQIGGNRISENGSIGLDVTSGGLTEADIYDNVIVNNTGIGVRFLGTQSKVRFRRNRSGDTRASGKTQTYGLELSATFTFTDFTITDNDLTGASVSAVALSGTVSTGCEIRRNKGYGPDAVAAVTVTASPMTYNVGARPEQLWVIGGTWTSIQINGQTVLTSAGTLDVEPNDAVTFTYTGAPTAIKSRKL